MQEQQVLTKKQRRLLKKEEQQRAQIKEKKKKKIKSVFVGLVVATVIVFLGYLISLRGKNVKIYPPTSTRGHIESSPESHILTEPMPENVQKHMLEHADGFGPPGRIIQYNCKKFECKDDLIEKLTSIAKDYPRTVYLAPGPRYDGKIILTKFGKREILEQFDEEKIRNFIK